MGEYGSGMTSVRSTYTDGRKLPTNRRLSIKLKILGTQGQASNHSQSFVFKYKSQCIF